MPRNGFCSVARFSLFLPTLFLDEFFVANIASSGIKFIQIAATIFFKHFFQCSTVKWHRVCCFVSLFLLVLTLIWLRKCSHMLIPLGLLFNTFHYCLICYKLIVINQTIFFIFYYKTDRTYKFNTPVIGRYSKFLDRSTYIEN